MRHLIGQRVRLHVNLQNGTIAIKAKVPGKGWRVVGYTCGATVTDATTYRMKDTCSVWTNRIFHPTNPRRQVVAWIEGTLTALDVTHPRWWTDGRPQSVHYNPYRCRDFTLRDGSILPTGTRFGTFTAIAGQCGYATDIREQ
jgi:hypothetical protein